MRKNLLRDVVLTVFTTVCLSACGSESTQEDDASGDTALLHTYTEDVRLCTPYLGSSTLDQWADWDPDNAGSVLGKLLAPDVGGDECIYAHSETLDDHIELINRFSRHWDEDGEHTTDGMTATVDTSVESVVVPYLGRYLLSGMSVSVDRMIVLESGSLTVRMAFTVDGGKETVVEQYEIGDAQAGVFYAVRDGDYRGLWQASVRDARTQFIWEGDIQGKWFRISECTDAAGNWEVMGGGGVADDDAKMAFMARNHANSDSGEEFYLAITLEELKNGSKPAAGIIDAGSMPPNGVDELAYITQSSSGCFGFLGNFEYPNDVDELNWMY